MTELSKKVITFGCRLNNLESELIDQQLKQNLIDKNTFITRIIPNYIINL